ncbi:hypothetical protein NONO_c47640 [Nocardia nova SH22a]|uniref:Uncharacterized protein n=1 Tax=Nocardia nova SH22a TaxID=1415166 RepID=W5TKR2_9NOCA|nr:hypothetical protein NONO_c47640 [Nocardia nova SH22a]
MQGPGSVPICNTPANPAQPHHISSPTRPTALFGRHLRLHHFPPLYPLNMLRATESAGHINGPRHRRSTLRQAAQPTPADTSPARPPRSGTRAHPPGYRSGPDSHAAPLPIRPRTDALTATGAVSAGEHSPSRSWALPAADSSRSRMRTRTGPRVRTTDRIPGTPVSGARRPHPANTLCHRPIRGRRHGSARLPPVPVVSDLAAGGRCVGSAPTEPRRSRRRSSVPYRG